MNQQQVMGLIRQVLPIIGTIAIANGVEPGKVASISDALVTAAGALFVVGSGVWSLKSKTNKAIVASAIALPEVKSIECAATPAGVKLADSVPSADVVAAPPLAGITEGPWRKQTREVEG